MCPCTVAWIALNLIKNFFSDDTSTQLEMIKSQIRYEAASKIQAAYRGYQTRKSWPATLSHLRSETKHVKPSHSYNRRGSSYAYDSGYNTPQSHHRVTTTASSVNLNYEHNLLNTHTEHLFHRKPTFKNMVGCQIFLLPIHQVQKALHDVFEIISTKKYK